MLPSDEHLNKTLKQIAELIGPLSDLIRETEQFVRDIHFYWKKQGGQAVGKPRHSDRYLSDRLNAQGTPVRSLTPKLIGKTRLQPRDGNTLVSYFLLNWPKSGNDQNVTYEPLISKRQIDSLAAAVEEHLEPRKDSVADSSQSFPGEDVEGLIVRMYHESDALITVSPEHTLIVAHPRTELVGFRNLMNKLHEIDIREEKERPLIWILDLGWRIFDDLDSRMKFLNIASVATRFRALEVFKDPERDERWEWFRRRAIIVLLDWTRHPVPQARDFPRPEFSAAQVSLSEYKDAKPWLSEPNFRALYGKELEDIELRSFSVFYKDSAGSISSEVDSELRYFGYAQFSSDADHVELEARGLALPSPGENYDEAFRVVYAAAVHVLGLKSAPAEGIKISGENALKQLNYLGFSVLTLEDFFKRTFGGYRSEQENE
ncbi:MAG: hypothetical protein WAN43_02915 [Rhodomicrobium sp.]